MMQFLDRCVDTHAKRRSLVKILAILLIIYMMFTYIRLATHIIFLQTYDDLFALLALDGIQETYIVRVILALLTTPEFTVLEVIKILFISLRIIDIVTVAIMFLLAFYHRIKYQVYFRTILLFSVLSIFVSVCLALVGLQANTLQVAILQVRNMGITFLICNCMSCLLLLYILFRFEAHIYREALLYRVEEILDNEVV